LYIGNSAFEPNTTQPGIFEFAVDTLLVDSHENEGEEVDSIAIFLRRGSKDSRLAPVNGLVKLVSLFTINHPSNIYESVLILGKSRTQPYAYERVGLATGKIYLDEMTEDRVPEHIRPFEWLAVASASEYSTIENAVMETIEIV
jgi:hypothetical protein